MGQMRRGSATTVPAFRAAMTSAGPVSARGPAGMAASIARDAEPGYGDHRKTVAQAPSCRVSRDRADRAAVDHTDRAKEAVIVAGTSRALVLLEYKRDANDPRDRA